MNIFYVELLYNMSILKSINIICLNDKGIPNEPTKFFFNPQEMYTLYKNVIGKLLSNYNGTPKIKYWHKIISFMLPENENFFLQFFKEYVIIEYKGTSITIPAPNIKTSQNNTEFTISLKNDIPDVKIKNIMATFSISGFGETTELKINIEDKYEHEIIVMSDDIIRKVLDLNKKLIKQWLISRHPHFPIDDNMIDHILSKVRFSYIEVKPTHPYEDIPNKKNNVFFLKHLVMCISEDGLNKLVSENYTPVLEFVVSSDVTIDLNREVQTYLNDKVLEISSYAQELRTSFGSVDNILQSIYYADELPSNIQFTKEWADENRFTKFNVKKMNNMTYQQLVDLFSFKYAESDKDANKNIDELNWILIRR